MALKVSAPDGVKVYTVGSGKSMPAWLSEAKKRALRKDEDYRRRLELLQDLSFPSSCSRIKITPDANYMFATGIHPPMVKAYDLGNLALKFDRHLDAEVVDFQVLSDDYSKLAFLCADRRLTFHARYGSHFTTRTPHQGRGLAFDAAHGALLVVGSCSQLYRLDLAEGRFLAPLESGSPAVNACGISPAHGLFGVAGEDGALECWDLRVRKAVGRIDAAAAAGAPGAQLTALRFDAGGLCVAAGTSSGLVGVWDLRTQRPSLVKDHLYGDPILDVKWHTAAAGLGGGGSSLDARRIISADRHVVKIWDATSGAAFTSLEPPEGADINHVCVWPGSGLLLLGLDAPRVGAYFVPSLGPAPRWASFLEGLTEELEESAPRVYDDYRFVTRSDLSRLGLDHLLGSALLRAYMHGFFIDARLHAKAAAAAAPGGYEAWRAARVAAKLEDERASRISVARRLPKVNRQVAARLLAQQAAEQQAAAGDEQPDAGPAAKRRKAAGAAPEATPLTDPRFAAMFEDADFAVDEASAEYLALHPNLGPGQQGRAKRPGQQPDLLAEHFTPLSDDGDEEDNDEPQASGSSGGGSGSEDEGGAAASSGEDAGGSGSDGEAARRAGRKPGHWQALKRLQQQPAKQQQQQQQQGKQQLERQGKKRPRQPVMYVAKDSAAAAAFSRGESLAGTLSQPLETRLAHGGAPAAPRAWVGGSRELTFVPRGGRGRGRGSGRGRGRGAARGRRGR